MKYPKLWSSASSKCVILDKLLSLSDSQVPYQQDGGVWGGVSFIGTSWALTTLPGPLLGNLDLLPCLIFTQWMQQDRCSFFKTRKPEVKKMRWLVWGPTASEEVAFWFGPRYHMEATAQRPLLDSTNTLLVVAVEEKVPWSVSSFAKPMHLWDTPPAALLVVNCGFCSAEGAWMKVQRVSWWGAGGGHGALPQTKSFVLGW